MAKFIPYNKEVAELEEGVILYYRYNKEKDIGFIWIENGTCDVKFQFTSDNVKLDVYNRHVIDISDIRYSLLIVSNVFDGECFFVDKDDHNNNMTIYLNSIPTRLLSLRKRSRSRE